MEVAVYDLPWHPGQPGSHARRWNTRRQRSAPTKTARCIILYAREGNLTIPATSSLKRSRTLPNWPREEAGVGRSIVQLQPKQAFFSQGSSADSIFYLQTGRAKLTVVSHEGKEATVALLSAGEFIGEESLASVGGLHMATASAIDL